MEKFLYLKKNLYLLKYLNNYYLYYKYNNKFLSIKFLINNNFQIYNFNLIIKNILFKFLNIYNFYFKIFNIGLGYKNFVYNNFLYLYLGDANFYKIKINKNLNIICKKNQIIIISKNKEFLFNFIHKISKIKKINIYKGKGIIPYNNFKFMKLKKGKKKN